MRSSFIVFKRAAALSIALWAAGGFAPSSAILLAPSPGGPFLYLRARMLAPPPFGDDRSSSLAFLRPGSQEALIQFVGPVHDVWKETVASAGLRLLRYIPDFAFVARGDRAAFLQASFLPFVRWIGPEAAANRIAPALPAAGIADALIEIEPGTDPSALLNAARAAGLEAYRDGGDLVRTRGESEAIRALAARDDVAWICPPVSMELLNDHSRALIGANTVWNELGLLGEGQIIGIVDTGLDTGNLDTLSTDFQGRVEQAFSLTGDGLWEDDHGHGTHVSGAIVGQGGAVTSAPDPHSFAGVAPRAKLVVQAIKIAADGTELGIPDDLNTLYEQAYDAGARIHNDSWGDDFSPYGSYSLHSSQIDDFIWNHPDMTIVFPAGNDGTDSPTVGASPQEFHGLAHAMGDGVIHPGSLYAPGTAKNSLSVGASEGDRPPDGGWGGFTTATWSGWGFRTPPISTDYTGDHPNGMTPYSSRGPTADGRIKPDLVAPGSSIISSLSSRAASNLWGLYMPGYAFSGGTSIATGFVTGSAALVREWYQTRKVASPSAALIKATLLNGARDLSPGQYGTGATREIPDPPNGVEGWGRVDVGMAIDPPAPLAVAYADAARGLQTDQGRTWMIRVTQSGQPLRIMLVWSDYPGAPDASVALVNDLDLTVTAPDGTAYAGNGRPDRRNNVEAVDLPGAGSGIYRVTVRGYNVPEGPQPFALAALGSVGRMVRPGDVNGDGAVTVVDVGRVLQAVVGNVTLTADERLAADVSPLGAPDGRIDISDVTTLLQAVVGLVDPGAAPPSVPPPGN